MALTPPPMPPQLRAYFEKHGRLPTLTDEQRVQMSLEYHQAELARLQGMGGLVAGGWTVLVVAIAVLAGVALFGFGWLTR